MTDSYFRGTDQHQYTSTQTIYLPTCGDTLDPISSSQVRIYGRNSPIGGVRNVGFIEEVATASRADGGRRPYPVMLRILAVSGAVCILLGIPLGIMYPGRLTGALLPLGLVLFSVAGGFARRFSRDKR